jgi:hypothetical protein
MGTNPVGPGLCLGSTGGEVLFIDGIDAQVAKRYPISHSKSAVNGVAGIGSWLAVSTPHDVNFVNLAEPADNPHGKHILHHGAHDVVLLPNGAFACPMGHMGLYVLTPDAAAASEGVFYTPDKPDSYLYRAFGLRDEDGQVVLICAARRDGVVAVPFRSGHVSTAGMRPPNFDAVDICALSHQYLPRALAVLSKEGSVALLRDAVSGVGTVVFKSTAVTGTAYRVASAKGHLMVLTSNGIVVFDQLAATFLEGRLTASSKIPAIKLNDDAVDIATTQDELLLVVMTDEVRVAKVSALTEYFAQIAGFLPGLGESAPDATVQVWKDPAILYDSFSLTSVV